MKKNPRASSVLLLWVAGLLLVAGGGSAMAGVVQAREGGYFTTEPASFLSSSSALLTDEIDFVTGQPGDPQGDLGELARVRVRVFSADPDARLFVGIGPRDEVRRYLAGTAYDEFTGSTTKPFRADFRRVPGASEVTPPGSQTFWVAQSSGGRDVTLEWDKTAGPWSLVVANADGRPGLDVRADVGLRFGFLTPLGVGLLAAGFGTLVAGLAWRRTAGASRVVA